MLRDRMCKKKKKHSLKQLEGLVYLEQNCGWEEGDRSEAQVEEVSISLIREEGR